MYDCVTINATILQVKEPVTVSTGKRKQQVILGDDTGSITLTLWGGSIDCLQQNTSYQFCRVQINEFLGKQELNYPRFGASFKEIQDLPEVCLVNEEQEEDVLLDAVIIAFNQL